MSIRITLVVTEGDWDRKKLLFRRRSRCVVGRARDCQIQLASDNLHMDVSRHHCLFDIDPPYIRVRDLGSLNGTYLNGRRIGCQGDYVLEDEVLPGQGGEVELLNGDEIRVGRTSIRILIEAVDEQLEAALSAAGYWPE